MKVALLAPPWLKIPPRGFGGIETIVFDLARGLKNLGVDVELFSIGESKIPGVKVHYLYEHEQFRHAFRHMTEIMPLHFAHLQFSLNHIREAGDFDIMHDHNMSVIGSPLILEYATQSKHMPPALHTLHGPPFSDETTLAKGIPDNRPFFAELRGASKLFYTGISHAITRGAPDAILTQTLPPVYNALYPEEFMFKEKKQDYFMTLARFSRVKGQHIAAKICGEHNYTLKMAGMVSDIANVRQLERELANPESTLTETEDFIYYKEKVLPLLTKHTNIEYIGNLAGARKKEFIADAKALLFPIDWEEPFGMAVVEALVSGTPVVAMNRGAMPEIIEHGVNGFLANSEEEFAAYMRQVDLIDPAICRQSVIEKFSVPAMAQSYLDRYTTILDRS